MADLRNVYDYYCPSPISLKKLVSMEVALILWRREIQQNVDENGTLREHHLRKKTSLQCLIPEVPRSILSLIEQEVINLASSISYWLDYHSGAGILKSNALKHFCDFVCDYNGEIHYGKTAKRFTSCEGISNDVKFKMACYYCLEDDILRIWPEVSSRVIANEVDYNKPLFDYWICRLTNEPYYAFDDETTIEELSLQELCEDYNCHEWSCAKYFLNCLPADTRMEHMANLLGPDRVYEFEQTFFRYMLAKLNETELKVLVKEHGAELVLYPCIPYNLRIWANIKNEISSEEFCRVVEYILKEQTENVASDDYDWPDHCEVWASAPNRLKQAAIRDALLVIDSSCFDRNRIDSVPGAADRRSVSFLLLMLSDASIEDRRKFWNNHWETVYIDIEPVEFRLLINLCFNDDQNQIIGFKKEVMSKYHRKIHPQLKKLLRYGCLEELEEFLTFWCPNKNSKEVRLKLLHDGFTITTELIGKASSLNNFIENAFEDKDLATDFKNMLFFLPDLKTIANLTLCIRVYEFRRVMEFVDIFALSDEIVLQIKERDIVPALKSLLIEPRMITFERYYDVDISKFLKQDFDVFENFISWLFESNNEIAQFKEALNVDTVIEKFIEGNRNRLDRLFGNGYVMDWFLKCFQTTKTPEAESVVKRFLKWYFVDPKVAEKFEEKYSHDYMFNRLLL